MLSFCIWGFSVIFFPPHKFYNTCCSRDGITQKQWDCPTALKPFPSATPHDRNTPATGQGTPGHARGQNSHGKRSTFLGTWHMQLWIAAVPGMWKWGERQKLLHIKLSSLLPGYSCHMLVFTAFLLPPNNCTPSIYSPTYKTRSLSLVYATKLEISGRSPWSQCWSV